MGSLCCGNYSDPLLFFELPVLGDEENVSENEEVPERFHSTAGKRVHFHSTVDVINPTIKQSVSETRSKSLVVPNRRRRGSPEMSLMEKIKARHTVINLGCIRDEYEGRQYCDALKKDTLMELKNTCQVAETIVQKGDDISEELARQGKVVDKLNHVLHSTEQDLNDASYRLRGMKSLGGKVVNSLWHRKPKAHAHSGYMCESRDFKTSSPSVSSHSLYNSPKRTSQQQIMAGVEQLCSTLDKVRNQQLVIADELRHQELDKFELNMDRIDGKIHNQTNLIHCFKLNNIT